MSIQILPPEPPEPLTVFPLAVIVPKTVVDPVTIIFTAPPPVPATLLELPPPLPRLLGSVIDPYAEPPGSEPIPPSPPYAPPAAYPPTPGPALIPKPLAFTLIVPPEAMTISPFIV